MINDFTNPLNLFRLKQVMQDEGLDPLPHISESHLFDPLHNLPRFSRNPFKPFSEEDAYLLKLLQLEETKEKVDDPLLVSCKEKLVNFPSSNSVSGPKVEDDGVNKVQENFESSFMRKEASESNLTREVSEEHQSVELPKEFSKGTSNVALVEAKDNSISINAKNVSSSVKRFPAFPLHYFWKKGFKAPSATTIHYELEKSNVMVSKHLLGNLSPKINESLSDFSRRLLVSNVEAHQSQAKKCEALSPWSIIPPH